MLMSEVGRIDDGLAPAEEAVAIRRRLANANPAAHMPDLAMSLSTLGGEKNPAGAGGERLMGWLGQGPEVAGILQNDTESQIVFDEMMPTGAVITGGGPATSPAARLGARHPAASR